MWLTVLVLAIAVNFEPTRIGLITLMLSKSKPMLHMLAFLCTTFVVTTGVGILVLLVFHHGIFTGSSFSGPKVQIGMGVVAVLIAAVLASNVFTARAKLPVDPGGVPLEQSADRPLARLSKRARRLVHGESPWLSGVMGLGVAVPSVDYMALLVLIAASGVAPMVQVGALLTFVVVGDIVVAIPLLCSLVAPERTRAVLHRLQNWVRARTRRDFAVLLTVVGVLMIAVGMHGLAGAG
jgi:hypothetical protein